jgi:hypothetical protein
MIVRQLYKYVMTLNHSVPRLDSDSSPLKADADFLYRVFFAILRNIALVINILYDTLNNVNILQS